MFQPLAGKKTLYENPYDPRYASAFYYDPNYQPPIAPSAQRGYLDSLVDSAQGGFGGIASGIGWFLEDKTGIGEDLGNWGSSLVENNQRTRQWNNDNMWSLDYFTSPEGFTWDVGQAGGSAIPIIASGAITAGATGGTGLPAWAAMIGAGAGIDTAVEMGSVYKDAKDRGYDEDQASSMANKAGLLNLPVSIASAGLDVAGARYLPLLRNIKGVRSTGNFIDSLVPSGGKVGKALKFGATVGADATVEGFQEGYQNAMERTVLDQLPLNNLLPNNWTEEDWLIAQQAGAGTLGMLGAGGGINYATDRITGRNNVTESPVESVPMEPSLGAMYNLNELQAINELMGDNSLGMSNELYQDYLDNYRSALTDDNLSFTDSLASQRDFLNRNQEALQEYDIFDINNKSQFNEDVARNIIDEEQQISQDISDKYNEGIDSGAILDSVLDQMPAEQFKNNVLKTEQAKAVFEKTLDENGNATERTYSYLDDVARNDNGNIINRNYIENQYRKGSLQGIRDWVETTAVENGNPKTAKVMNSIALNDRKSDLLSTIKTPEFVKTIAYLQDRVKNWQPQERLKKQEQIREGLIRGNQTTDPVVNYLKKTNEIVRELEGYNLEGTDKMFLDHAKGELARIADMTNQQGRERSELPEYKDIERYAKKLGLKLNTFNSPNTTVRATYLDGEVKINNNAKETVTLPFLFGHEFMHHAIKKDQAVLDRLMDLIPQQQATRHQLQLMQATGKIYTLTSAKEEMIADAMGEFFENKPEKLSKLLEGINDQTVFDRIMEMLKDWWNRFTQSDSEYNKQKLLKQMPKVIQDYLNNENSQTPNANDIKYNTDIDQKNAPKKRTPEVEERLQTDNLMNKTKLGNVYGDVKFFQIKKSDMQYQKFRKMAELLKKDGYVEFHTEDAIQFQRPNPEGIHNKSKEFEQTATMKEYINNIMDTYQKEGLRKTLSKTEGSEFVKFAKQQFRKGALTLYSATAQRYASLDLAITGDTTGSQAVTKMTQSMATINQSSENTAGGRYELGSEGLVDQNGNDRSMIDLFDGKGKVKVKGVPEIVSDIQKSLGRDYLTKHGKHFSNIALASMNMDQIRNNPNIITQFTLAEAQKLWNNAKPAEKQAINDISRLFRLNLKLAQESGFLSLDAYKQIVNRYPNYMYLIESKDVASSANLMIDNLNTGKVINAKNPVKRVKDSTASIIDPFNSLSAHTIAYQRAIDSNFSLKLMKETLTKKEFMNDFGELVIPISKDEAKHNDSSFYTWEGGEQQYYATSTSIANVLKNLKPYTTNTFIKFMSNFSGLVRIGTVLSPSFAINNFLMDMFTATVKHGFAVSPWKMIKNIKHISRETGYYKEMMQGGVIQGSRAIQSEYSKPGYAHEQHLENKAFDKTFVEGVREGNVFKVGRGVLHGLQRLSELGEQAVRYSVYEAYRDAGYSLEESKQHARELTDFSAGGANWFRSYVSMAPFGNPVIQGLRAIADPIFYHNQDLASTSPLRKMNIKTQRGAILFSLASLATMGTLMGLSFGDDEDYKNVPYYEKNGFIIIPFSAFGDNTGGYLRIPAGRELATFAYWTPQAVLDFARSSNPEYLRKQGKMMLDSVAPPLVPALAQNILEFTSGYSWFKERYIIPRSESDKPGVLQYGPYTSPSARLVSEWMYKFGIDVSPRILQHTVESMTSTSGKTFMNLMDEGLRQAGISHDLPAKQWQEKVPVFERYVKPRTGNERVQNALEIAKNYEQDKMALKEGLLSPTQFNASKANKIKSINGQLQRSFRTQSEIVNNQKLTAEQKRVKLDELAKKQRQWAEKIFEIDEQ